MRPGTGVGATTDPQPQISRAASSETRANFPICTWSPIRRLFRLSGTDPAHVQLGDWTETHQEAENCVLNLNQQVIRSPSRQLSSTCSVLGEIQLIATNLKTPTKPQENDNSDPWTPTANLKMLISAASPEIRNREREILEEQFSGDELEKTLPSRKEKSLGLLCHKFLARYPSFPNPAVNNSICLDEVAGELNVERRRIYDIVNVLESLHMVSRLAKNRYIWHGRLNLSKTFDALRKVGEENKYAEQILLLKKREQEESEANEVTTETLVPKSLVKPMDVSFVELPGLEFRAASVNSRKEKSLRVMSQRFVMLFLVSKPQIVSLEVAAKILIGEDQLEDLDKSKFKTKIRRLYDIANVLSSLDLIKKVHVTEEKGRKPAFQWTGPESFTQEQVHVASPIPQTSVAIDLRSPKEHCAKNLFSSRGKQNFTRHPSLIKLAKSIENDRRKINSAPSSPIKTDGCNNSAANSSKMAQLAAICREQLEKSNDQNKMKIKIARSTFNCKGKGLIKPALHSEEKVQKSPCLSPAFCQAIPLIHSHSNSAPSYAVYLQPPPAVSLPSQSPSVPAHPVPCANSGPYKTLLDTAVGESNMSQDAVTKGGGMSQPGNPPARDGSAQDMGSKRLPEPDGHCTFKRIKSSSADELSERLYPSGYLIPLQLAPMGGESSKESSASSPEHQIFTSPIAGVIPLKLMFSPGTVAAVPVVSQPGQHMSSGPSVTSQSPSPTMFNFTLQNRELISQGKAHPGISQSASLSPRNGRVSEELTAAQVLNFKHMSPVPYHGQPFTVFTFQQPGVPVTPNGCQQLHENFFRTPGRLTSIPTESGASNNNSVGPVLISQRKLDVGTEDS
ncbi:transcription factor E2F8 [Rhinophrynus dorsalis]